MRLAHIIFLLALVTARGFVRAAIALTRTATTRDLPGGCSLAPGPVRRLRGQAGLGEAGADEACQNGRDDDCDGATDAGLAVLLASCRTTMPTATPCAAGLFPRRRPVRRLRRHTGIGETVQRRRAPTAGTTTVTVPPMARIHSARRRPVRTRGRWLRRVRRGCLRSSGDQCGDCDDTRASVRPVQRRRAPTAGTTTVTGHRWPGFTSARRRPVRTAMPMATPCAAGAVFVRAATSAATATTAAPP